MRYRAIAFRETQSRLRSFTCRIDRAAADQVRVTVPYFLRFRRVKGESHTLIIAERVEYKFDTFVVMKYRETTVKYKYLATLIFGNRGKCRASVTKWRFEVQIAALYDCNRPRESHV